LYVVLSAAWALWRGVGQEFSLPGLIVAMLAMPVMYAFAKVKLRLARELKSGALRSDAVESIACSYLSAVVIVGLLAQYLVNAWWIDGVTSLALVPFLLREARKAWHGESDES
jgi:divalent metal cation (Fe/Co/Zn/Cd) transporter